MKIAVSLHFPNRLMAVCLLSLLAASCAVGPDYRRPELPAVAAFKEAEGWVAAAPADALERGPWWQLFGDPVLDQLAARVEVSNQNVAAAVAAYAQARALIRERRAALFPSVTLEGGASRARSGGNLSTGAAGRTGSNYQLGIGGNWEPDIWGRLGRGACWRNAPSPARSAAQSGNRQRIG